LVDTISKSQLQAQRERYVAIRDDAVRMAKIFKDTAMSSDIEELAKCTNAALVALDKAIETASRTNHG
jgi:hypothetical protein